MCRALLVLLSVLWCSLASAATIDSARPAKTSFNLVPSVTVEGDITSGDTTKLLIRLLELYHFRLPDEVPCCVYLASRGGDADEAMKMGELIRELRLDTTAPERLTADGPPFCLEALADQKNCVCASACFLAYAGGVYRLGDVLALHRPYVDRKAAAGFTDIQQEALEKEALAKVRAYLEGMEVNQFFIDKVIWTNSQEAYVVTTNDTANYHLLVAPSIEEILLSRCNGNWAEDFRALQSAKDDPPLKDILIKKLTSIEDCKNNTLNRIRIVSFERRATEISKTCSNQMDENFRAWERGLRVQFDYDGTIFHEMLFTWEPKLRSNLAKAGFSTREIDDYLDREEVCWLALVIGRGGESGPVF